jgi:hypothetical protein
VHSSQLSNTQLKAWLDALDAEWAPEVLWEEQRCRIVKAVPNPDTTAANDPPSTYTFTLKR